MSANQISEEGDVPVLFSGSSDKTIRAWNALTGECLRKLEGHRRGIESIQCQSPFHSDDTLENVIIFSSSSDGTIRKWDVVSGNCLMVFEGHLTNVYQIWLQDDSELFSCSADNTAKLWDVVSEGGKKCVKTFEHPDLVRCCAVYENRYLITGCRDEKVRVWDKVEGNVVYGIDAHLDEVSSLLVNPLTGDLFTGSFDGTVRKWSLKELLSQTQPKPKSEPKQEKQLDGMTADEERELEQLLNED